MKASSGQSSGHRGGSVWPFPWAASAEPVRLSRDTWLLLVAAFLVIHFAVLLVALRTGNFDFEPNRDHSKGMHQVLAQGYPTVSWWPPIYAYYLAGTTLLTRALGMPFWAGKLLIDPFVFVASGLLATSLGLLLTRNRVLAITSGLGLTCAPLFALSSAEGLAELLFQPIFLAALWLLARELQRNDGPRLGGLMAAGATMGLATLVRANPQFLILAMSPFFWWLARRRGARRPLAAGAGAVLAALLGQAVVQLPWALVQRSRGASGLMAANVFYRSFYNGMSRQRGFRVGDESRGSPANDPSLRGIARFHQRWLREDPIALVRIYAVKLARAWYLSSSGRWDRAIALLHSPLWLLAACGVVVWILRARSDPALWLSLWVIAYMWMVAALASGLARYTASLYGFVGAFAGVSLLAMSSGGRSHDERSRPISS